MTLTLAPFTPGKPVYMALEWEPDQPTRLSSEEWREYRAGRQHSLSKLAAELGISIAVLEL